MFGLAEYAIRLLGKYGALAAVLVLAALSLTLVLVLLRQGLRPSPSMIAPGIMLAFAVAGLVALAQPAAAGLSQINRALAARTAASPAPSGPFAVSDLEITLEAAEAPAIAAHLWHPRNAGIARRLVLYAPGIGGDRMQNALLAAELASQGYVVLAIDDLAHDPEPEGESPEQAMVREGAFSYRNEAELAASIRAGDRRAALYAERARQALDRFSAIADDESQPWGGRVDTGEVAFVGYSFGAAAGAELAAQDARVVALANLDGALYGKAARDGVAAPYFLLLSDMRSRVPAPQTWRRNLEHRIIARELAAAEAQARLPDNEIHELRLAPHAAFADEYFNAIYWRDWLLVDPHSAYDFMRTRLVAFLAAYAPASAHPAAPRRAEEVMEVEGRDA